MCPGTQSGMGVGEEDDGGKSEESQFGLGSSCGVPKILISISDMCRRYDIDSLLSNIFKLAQRDVSDFGSFEAPFVVMRPLPRRRDSNPGGNIAHISSLM